jgi:hypothetical protein
VSGNPASELQHAVSAWQVCGRSISDYVDSHN